MNILRDVEDPRQRAADYAAVFFLARAAAIGVTLPVAQLASLVAEFLVGSSVEELRTWSQLEAGKAVRGIKLDILRGQIAQAGGSGAGAYPPGAPARQAQQGCGSPARQPYEKAALRSRNRADGRCDQRNRCRWSVQVPDD